MCLILDTNMFSSFSDPENQDMRPIKEWLDKRRGKLVYSPTKKFAKELNKHQKFKELFVQYREAGRVKMIRKANVKNQERQLLDNQERQLPTLQSNDHHIIALALEANCTLLVSGDHALHADFRKYISKGKIYQNKGHDHLLTQDRCPE